MFLIYGQEYQREIHILMNVPLSLQHIHQGR